MALKEALAKSPAQKPPNLRAASRPTQSCATCRYFKRKGVGAQGACRLYGGYPVSGNQVCDSYKA